MYIKVIAHPKSRKEEVIKKTDTRFEVWVKEPAERNLANERIIEIIKMHFPTSKQVRIINGHNSPSKLLSIE